MRFSSLAPLLLVVLALLSCALPFAHAQTLLASSAGVSLQRSLRLQGVDVGATLKQLDDQLERHQALIDELMRRNSSNTALLQQYEQKFEQLQQTINNQRTVIDAQETRIEQLQSNSTVLLPGGGSSTVVEVVTQQQTLIEQLVERNNTVQRMIDDVTQQIDQLGEQDWVLEQQLREVNTSLTARIDEHSGHISELNTLVDALLTPTIVHAVAGSEQATVRWSLASATVTASPGGATCETDGLSGESQCTVGGLTNGVNYTFTAQLTNAAGPGRVSPRSNEVTPWAACFALTAATAGDGGVVTSNPANSVHCSAGEYTEGTLVTLTAIPDAGFGVSWSGPPSGVADAALLTFSLRMPDAAETVVAAFAQCFALTVDVLVGSGSAIIAAPSNTAGCAAGAFVPGASVTLKATPAAGWSFNGWSGTVTAGFGTAVWSFLMPASAATQRASFAQCLPLTVSRQPADGSGGSVLLSPSNSAGCPPGRFLQGAALILTATPAAGWGFAGWTGALSSSDATWSYTMGSAAAVQTAQFASCFPLTLAATGPAGGAVSASPSNSYGCAAGSYASGATLSLSATVPAGSTFLRWSGSGASGSSSSLTFTMPASAANITAALATCVQVTMATSGNGMVNLISGWLHSCASQRYPVGSPMTAIALPNAGSTFKQWTGTYSGVSTTLPFTMPATPVTLTATFSTCRALTLVVDGCGTIGTPSPVSAECPAGQFAEGSSVTVPVTAGASCTFSHWSGASANTTAPLTFPIPTNDATLQANFKQCYPLSLLTAGPTGSVTINATNSLACAAGSYVAGAVMSVSTLSSGAVATFRSWSGAVTSFDRPLIFTMPAGPATLTANFVACVVLSLNSLMSPPAGGSIGTPLTTWSHTCTVPNRWPEGAPITVQASANGGSTFGQWTGVSTSLDNPHTFVMPGTTSSINANFYLCNTLQRTASPAAGGTITAPDPASGGTCVAGKYGPFTNVTMTAVPNSGYGFVKWSGSGATSTEATLVYTTLAVGSSLTATFALCNPVLTSVVAGNGSVSFSPSSSTGCAAGSFAAGAAVTVTALPATYYVFEQWGGAASGTDNTATFTMPATSPTVQVSFEQRNFVYGQLTFTETTINNPAAPAGGLWSPFGLAVNAADELIVSDNSNHRILVYPFGSLTPTRVIGQNDFVSKTANRGLASVCAANTLSLPLSVSLDASGNMLVADGGNSRVLFFPAGAGSSTSAIRVYGQSNSFSTRYNIPTNAATMNGPSAAVFGDGGVFIADTYNHRVLYYSGTSTTVTRLYGQPDYTSYTPQTTGNNGFKQPRGLAVDASGGLYVSDMFNNRVLYFPQGQTTASVVLGQADFTTVSSNRGLSGPNAGTLSGPQGVLVRPDGVYVGDRYNKRVLRYPLGGTTADKVWGQPSFTANAAQPLSNTSYSMVFTVAFDSRGYLYVLDDMAHRVLRITP